MLQLNNKYNQDNDDLINDEENIAIISQYLDNIIENDEDDNINNINKLEFSNFLNKEMKYKEKEEIKPIYYEFIQHINEYIGSNLNIPYIS